MNHLGTVLLALLLLPKLSVTPGMPRITIVSSGLHFRVKKIEEAESKHILATLNDPETAKMGARYNLTKREYFLECVCD